VWFSYSPDRKGEHPQRHLANFRGILQADAYAGFNKLYEGGAIQEAPCMAHYLESGVIWSASLKSLVAPRQSEHFALSTPDNAHSV